MLQTKVSFEAKSKINTFLGEKGEDLLKREVNLILDIALKNELPLDKITIGVERDAEIKSWKYVLAKLAFSSTFDEADTFFKLICSQIDAFESTLDAESKAGLLDKLYYVFETV
mgnify:CR=1 FL=1